MSLISGLFQQEDPIDIVARNHNKLCALQKEDAKKISELEEKIKELSQEVINAKNETKILNSLLEKVEPSYLVTLFIARLDKIETDQEDLRKIYVRKIAEMQHEIQNCKTVLTQAIIAMENPNDDE